ncbi:MAG: flagellar protein FlgN [Nitrosomonadales bacterium]|nr:flagellar protein FlgN [Nitrosomonadales bacterium]
MTPLRMGKASPPAMADLSSRLYAERDALGSFIALLETEQEALLGGDTERLLALSESKVRATGELVKLAEARRNDLHACGAAMGADGAAAWLQAHAANLLPAWRSIKQLAGEARHLNRTNGALIQSRLRHNQQALVVLQNAARNANGLYGPDGQPHMATTGRILGSV